MQHHKVSDQPGILHFDHFRLEGRPVERKDKLSSNEAHFQDIAAIDIINALLQHPKRRRYGSKRIEKNTPTLCGTSERNYV